MSKLGCLLLFVLLAGAQMLEPASRSAHAVWAQTQDLSTPSIDQVPTVTVYQGTPLVVPTVNIPQSTATPAPTPTPRPVRHRKRHHAAKHKFVRRKATKPSLTWIVAYLTSYCPGSAGWISASGVPVHYGMLANNEYTFGTRVYIPVIGITGVVEDRLGSFASWNHFDVWSASCYATPTGYFRVAIVNR